jgi:hypothetical protein
VFNPVQERAMATDNHWSKPKALAIPKEAIFEKLDGFPEDWKTNARAFIEFVREHQCPSFLEYGEYPYVSAAEIKKALAVKQAFSSMLDHMQ